MNRCIHLRHLLGLAIMATLLVAWPNQPIRVRLAGCQGQCHLPMDSSAEPHQPGGAAEPDHHIQRRGERPHPAGAAGSFPDAPVAPGAAPDSQSGDGG